MKGREEDQEIGKRVSYAEINVSRRGESTKSILRNSGESLAPLDARRRRGGVRKEGASGMEVGVHERRPSRRSQ